MVDFEDFLVVVPEDFSVVDLEDSFVVVFKVVVSEDALLS